MGCGDSIGSGVHSGFGYDFYIAYAITFDIYYDCRVVSSDYSFGGFNDSKPIVL